MSKNIALVMTICLLALVGCDDKSKTTGPATAASSDTEPQPIAAPAFTPVPAASFTAAPPPSAPPVVAQPVVEAPTPIPAPETVKAPKTIKTTDKTYTIQSGDTIYGIARRIYGDGKKAKQILAANPDVDPAKLKVGQKIVLP